MIKKTIVILKPVNDAGAVAWRFPPSQGCVSEVGTVAPISTNWALQVIQPL
jgi:hypothetical protein